MFIKKISFITLLLGATVLVACSDPSPDSTYTTAGGIFEGRDAKGKLTKEAKAAHDRRVKQGSLDALAKRTQL